MRGGGGGGGRGGRFGSRGGGITGMVHYRLCEWCYTEEKDIESGNTVYSNMDKATQIVFLQTSKNSAASSASTFSEVKEALQECQKLSRACSYCQ